MPVHVLLQMPILTYTQVCQILLEHSRAAFERQARDALHDVPPSEPTGDNSKSVVGAVAPGASAPPSAPMLLRQQLLQSLIDSRRARDGHCSSHGAVELCEHLTSK